jgi:hypothetical protein
LGSYPCSNCGSTADTATGCPSCGRTLDAEIAELNLTISRMQRRNKGMVEERTALMSRLQGAIAIRQLLLRAAARHEGTIASPRLSRIMPTAGKSRPMDMPIKRPGRRNRPTTVTTPASTVPPPRTPADPTIPVGAASTSADRPTTGQPTSGRSTNGRPTTSRTKPGGDATPPAGRPVPPQATGGQTAHSPHPPETSERESQNVVLALGAIVMAVAVILTPFFIGKLNGGAQAFILVVLTSATIAAPLLLSRVGLFTTSEWVSPLGLLFILLDGRALWMAEIRHSAIHPTTYAGLVMIVAAITAAVYQRVTRLAVPRFATIVLLQPIPALLLYPWISDLSAWAAVLVLVAAVDLIIAYRTDRSALDGHYFRLAVRTLQEVVNAGALVVGGIALAHARHALPSLHAGATVVAAAVIALAAGLLFEQRPLPDISAGVATLAAISGFGRMAALAVPGWGLTATAIAIAGCAVGVRLLPDYARAGAQIAGGIAAVATAIDVVRRGWTALTTPLRAATPTWRADLGAYAATVARGAGQHTGQLVPAVLLLAIAAAIMLPVGWRRNSLVIGVALAAILAPGALHLPWLAAIVLCALISVLIGAVTLTARNSTQSWTGIGAAFAVGTYATGVAIAVPAGQALLLGFLAIGGASVASGGASAVRLRGIVPDGRAIEAAWGAAAFTLPGAIAGATAVPAPHGAVVAEAVIASTFIAVAATLTAAAITQVAWRRPIPLLVGGAMLGALATAIAAIRTPYLAAADVVVAIALLASAILLVLAPVLSTGFRPVGSGRLRIENLDGQEVAAAAVTIASIAAFARVAALVAPGELLVIVAGLVLMIAAGTRSMPAPWRRGPVVGGGVVGALVAAAAGYAAFDAAITAIRLNVPIWHVNPAGWAIRLTEHTTGLAHGPQAAIALLLIAAAAAIVLPTRAAAVAVVTSVGLAALILPATLHTGSWGPMLFSGVGATVIGLAAATSADKVIAMTRGGVATLLFANTIAASLVAAGTTAGTLIASAAVSAAVAATGVRTIARIRRSDPNPDIAHLVLIAGGALAGAILSLAGGAATIAAAAHQPPTIILTFAMAGLGIALAIIASLSQRLEPVLPQVSGAISIGGMLIALAAVANFTTAGLFAALAALLSVLAEVMRAAVARQHNVIGSDGTPRRARVRVGLVIGWFPQRTEVLLAAGPATTLALASLAPTVVAALAGPYRFVGMAWQRVPTTLAGQLGPLWHLVGRPAGVVTAVVLVATATIGVIGFGGPRDTMMARAVAVVTPGIAVCLLIAPYLVRAPWPAGPLAALAVAVVSGLALALIAPPTQANTASSLHVARNVVVVLCALSTGAGIAGSLAARPMTIAALSIATATGGVAAAYGREQVSRITGWIVTATAGQLLVLVICLVADVKSYDAAFAVGAVAAALLIVAALLPRLRKPENLTENLTVEVSAYAGAVLGLVLAAQSIPHLAVFLGAWGAVLGIATARPQRSQIYRSALMWTAAAHELGAWFLLMTYAQVGVPEAYTLGIAVVALITGWIEGRWHPELTSWITYGIALSAALGPSLVILIATGQNTLRLVLLLIAATAVLLFGSLRRQQAPTIIGSVALLGAAINLAARYSTTILVLVLLAIIAGVLIGVGANTEKQRRQLQRAWTTINKMQ